VRKVTVSISAAGAKGDKGKRPAAVKAPTKKTFTSPRYLSLLNTYPDMKVPKIPKPKSRVGKKD
jgi:hypothetical protein